MTASTPESHPYKVFWQADQTHASMMEQFRDKMREVVDPELGLNIIDLGLIRDLQIQDQSAEIHMILTTPFCPYGPAMLEATRQKAEGFLERPVTIEMGFEPWDFDMMEEGVGADWGIF
jgi:metal-sulfur cluster biosynthetic enzyme